MGYLLLTQAPGLRQTDFNHSATENGGVTPPPPSEAARWSVWSVTRKKKYNNT